MNIFKTEIDENESVTSSNVTNDKTALANEEKVFIDQNSQESKHFTDNSIDSNSEHFTNDTIVPTSTASMMTSTTVAITSTISTTTNSDLPEPRNELEESNTNTNTNTITNTMTTTTTVGSQESSSPTITTTSLPTANVSLSEPLVSQQTATMAAEMTGLPATVTTTMSQITDPILLQRQQQQLPQSQFTSSPITVTPVKF